MSIDLSMWVLVQLHVQVRVRWPGRWATNGSHGSGSSDVICTVYASFNDFLAIVDTRVGSIDTRLKET